jgi:hypothetical protein
MSKMVHFAKDLLRSPQLEQFLVQHGTPYPLSPFLTVHQMASVGARRMGFSDIVYKTGKHHFVTL